MYNDQLEQATVSIDKIFLDPNNPRFWSEQSRTQANIADSKVPDIANQSRAMDRIKNHGLEELRYSILRNGFLPLDRIVVRKLEGVDDAYIVIEGNRRLAALKWLRELISEGAVDEEGIDADYLADLKAKTDQIEVLIYRGDETKDIAWILQGIRHISGIRDWMPAQQGKLVADQIEQEGLGLTEAGQRFGLSAQAVGKRYRSYKALQQMREDEEFKAKAENKFYSLFEEAIGQKSVKEWLGWKDAEKRFTNTENLKQFYSWITPDESHDENRRRIHDPRQIKSLGALIAASQDSLLNQIDNHEIDIFSAHQKLKDANMKFDWKAALTKAAELINDVPGTSLADHPDEVLLLLEKLEVKLVQLRAMAQAIKEKEDEKGI